MARTMWKLAAAAIVLSGVAWAQEEEDPGRGVARISLINGEVSVQRGDSGEWVAAAVNAPLVVNDHVLTGPGAARAEIQLDYANFLRMGYDSEVRLSEIEGRRYQVQIARGTVMFRVLRDSQAQVEIDTPNISIRPVKRGAYRITVGEDGQTELTVRSGEAEVSSPRGVERASAGRTMVVRGTQADPEFQVVHQISLDEWDRWNEDRDRRLEHTRSYDYVSQDIYGADELDNYGTWVNEPQYGTVWCPRGVGADWAPYQSGHWVWVDWYGWTWVSYDPWGWAPYHYGRWFYSGPHGWCWFPGQRYHRHYWSPALVAFFGFGHGVHVGIGFGSLGWVPLAPYEPYYRWYGRGFYGSRNPVLINNRMTVVNNVHITNIYRNARVANGVTGIEAGAFARGGRGTSVRVNEVMHNASLMRGPIPVTPVAESQRFSNRAVTAVPTRTAAQTRFYSARPAAAVERIPFNEQRRGMEQYVQRTYGAPGAAGRETTAGTVAGTVRPGPQGAVAGTSQGWRSVQSEPRGNTTGVRPDNGWRRFGEPGSQTERSVGSRNQNEALPRGNSGDVRVYGGQARPAGETRSDWRGFGARPGIDRPAESPSGGSRYEAPRNYQGNQGNGRYEAPRSEPVRINQPMVRERSEPRSESRSTSHVEHSAPAPSYHSSGGGGGNSGGGSHTSGGSSSSGGGGGGSHHR